MADKLDLKKSLDAYGARTGRIDVVDVPQMQFLMIDGHGDPNSAVEFGAAIEALYPIAYALKFASRNELGRDYVVMPLEGLWWADDHASFTSARDKSKWRWTLMIMQPDWIDREMFFAAAAKASAKRPSSPVSRVRFEPFAEGLSVQTLHVGSYEDEAPVLASMHEEFIPVHGLRERGIHHEVYFSDPRKGDPARRRTLLRQPVERLS